MEIFDVKDLSFSYPNADRPALNGLSFCVRKSDFITLAGATGSGKTTLLRLLKPELSPKGEREGEILFSGEDISRVAPKASALEIGFVAQDPDRQIVTDKVWHELAFGLENLGFPQSVIARRIAESASFFGLDSVFEKRITELSGGQKQLLCLAAVTAMEPEVLLLDEPTAQLDPVSAKSFLSAVKRLNRELGVTVILAEHRLEDVIPLSDKLMILENGRMLSYDPPGVSLRNVKKDSPLYFYLPGSVRLWYETGGKGEIPIDIRTGRHYLKTQFPNRFKIPEEPKKEIVKRAPALEFKNVFFRYEKESQDVLKGLSLRIDEGEIFCILGPNASGKTTALNLASALSKPYAGKIRIFDKQIRDYKNQSLYRSCLSYLPQDVTAVFLRNTVREEIKECGADITDLSFDFSPLLDLHPYDLSGGEQQLLGLLKALSKKPRLLLLDEPTKGVDPFSKEQLKGVIKEQKQKGITVVIVTHDVEFAADIADRCALLFRGECVCAGTPREILSEGQFYTTSVSKITKGIFDRTVTLRDAVTLCEKNGRRGV